MTGHDVVVYHKNYSFAFEDAAERELVRGAFGKIGFGGIDA